MSWFQSHSPLNHQYFLNSGQVFPPQPGSSTTAPQLNQSQPQEQFHSWDQLLLSYQPSPSANAPVKLEEDPNPFQFTPIQERSFSPPASEDSEVEQLVSPRKATQKAKARRTRNPRQNKPANKSKAKAAHAGVERKYRGNVDGYIKELQKLCEDGHINIDPDKINEETRKQYDKHYRIPMPSKSELSRDPEEARKQSHRVTVKNARRIKRLYMHNLRKALEKKVDQLAESVKHQIIMPEKDYAAESDDVFSDYAPRRRKKAFKMEPGQSLSSINSPDGLEPGYLLSSHGSHIGESSSVPISGLDDQDDMFDYDDSVYNTHGSHRPMSFSEGPNPFDQPSLLGQLPLPHSTANLTFPFLPPPDDNGLDYSLFEGLDHANQFHFGSSMKQI